MPRISQFFLNTTALLFTGELMAQTSVPEIAFDSAPNLLKLPEHIYLGEVPGVATNSKGNIFVYTRTGTANATEGTSRTFTHGGARLFEFAPNGNFVREMGVGVYGFLFAHGVRVDPQDNIWVIDEGSSMLIKFNPEGRIVMTMGRNPEAISVGREGGGEGVGRGPAGRPGAGAPGDNFNRPTDVAWDAAGKIFVGGGVGKPRLPQIRQERELHQILGLKRDRARPVQHSAFDRDRYPGQRLRGGSRKQADSGF